MANYFISYTVKDTEGGVGNNNIDLEMAGIYNADSIIVIKDLIKEDLKERENRIAESIKINFIFKYEGQ